MTTFVGSAEAARLLGVTTPTLYAYVSRGIVQRRTAVDGRTSLYARDEIEQLATRSRRRQPTERPSIDVRINSAITELQDEGVSYRGHDVATLAENPRFEQVAELLWSGTLPAESPTWQLDREALARCRAVIGAAGSPDPITTLTLAVSTLGVGRTGDAAPDAARRILAVAPSVLGGPQAGGVAERLAKAWTRRPGPALIETVARALVLLADHELATSTLAVRVACSVRTDPYAAIATGLNVVKGPLHGAAAVAATDLLDEAERVGAATAVHGHLAVGRRLPGFGHSVYRNGDPRFTPLLDAVRRLPDPAGRRLVVDAVLAEAGRSIGHLPNVDLALGALLFVADLPRDAPLFAVARIAGWAAHYDEELTERPVRYRGLATTR